MHEFHNIKKVKLILSCLSVTQYSAWCGFFIFQGQAIQQAADKNNLMGQLSLTLLWFFLTKIVVMATDLTSKFVAEYFSNDEIAYQWQTHFPNRIYQDNENKSNLIYLTYFDYLPNLYSLECTIVSNKCTIVSVVIIVTSLLICTGFYYGAFALLAVFILNFFSKNICLPKLDNYTKEINENKALTLGWINQYFRAYREIAFNWHGRMNAWVQAAYHPLFESKRKLLLVQLTRDVLAQLMVEVPFIINTSIVIIAVYLNYFSITQMFVWVGFSQFVINASNAFLENNVNSGRKRVLVNKLNEMSLLFHDKKQLAALEDTGNSVDQVKIVLQDNTTNILSLR